MKPLTNFELRAYSDRIDEIDSILDQDDCPEDVHDNLINELDSIVEILESSIKLIQRRQSRLTLVS